MKCWRFLWLALGFVLSGCGGGGSTTLAPSAPGAPAPAPAPPTASSNPGAPTSSVAISVRIPATSAAASTKLRHALYVSPNTQSAAIAIDGGTPAVTNIAPGAPGCTTDSAGNRTCTLTANAPVGTDTVVVNLYASTNGTGTALSTSTSTQTIAAGTTNALVLTLGGVVASIGVALSDATPPTGTAANIGVIVTLRDASNATIVGADQLANPVTLTDSDTSGITKLSANTIANPSTPITLAYNGSALSVPAVIGASATGVATTAVTTATLTPSSSAPPTSTALTDWAQYGYDTERTGFNPSTSGITPTALAGVHLAWQTQAAQGGVDSQPIVATNVAGHTALVIVGAFPGMWAYDALTGAQVWQTNLPKQNLQTSSGGCGEMGPAGTAVYDAALGAIFVVDGNGVTDPNPNHVVLYELSAASGVIENQVDITGSSLLNGEVTAAHSALTLANGTLYVSTSSNCEGGNQPNWRGSVVAVNPNTMSIQGHPFYPTWQQSGDYGNYGGGGIWGLGGVSADANGNIYFTTGNAETSLTDQPLNIVAPFVPAPNENSGYGESLVKLSGDLGTVLGVNKPAFNFGSGLYDLDYTGTPTIYTPPLSNSCGTLTAAQNKSGLLVVNSASDENAPGQTVQISAAAAEAFNMGNPSYSPITGLLYVANASGQGALYPPGVEAITGCGASGIQWHTAFGPDSTPYGAPAHPPRTQPTVTSGDAIIVGTPCTPDSTNTMCGAPSSANLEGAVWALNAVTGALLNGGKPILITGDKIRVAPTADGLWIYVMDHSGNLYGLTVDPSVKPMSVRRSTRAGQTVHYMPRS